MVRKFVYAVVQALSLSLALPSAAHEFWLDPADFTVSAGDTIVAHLRVGTNFSGDTLSYVPGNFSRFEVAQGAKTSAVKGRLGDKPALRFDTQSGGLAVALYEATDASLTYDDWAVFDQFVAHKDLDGVIARHRARGLPETGFTETFSRHVKSLIAVGDGAGQDRAFGLRTEFVALVNPYTDNLSNGVRVRLLFEGAPRGNAQVELWDRAPGGSVSVTKHRTNENGVVALPVRKGHVYMADAVTMVERRPVPPQNAVWHSLWASLTFMVPAR